eukprot:6178089-Pleurochrysis_carterae.AAC.2
MQIIFSVLFKVTRIAPLEAMLKHVGEGSQQAPTNLLMSSTRLRMSCYQSTEYSSRLEEILNKASLRKKPISTKSPPPARVCYEVYPLGDDWHDSDRVTLGSTANKITIHRRPSGDDSVS